MEQIFKKVLDDMETKRLTGFVKWYSQDKGYGFIKAKFRKDDYFLHKNNIKCNENLVWENQVLSFVPVMEEKGLTAHDIKIPDEIDILEGKIIWWAGNYGSTFPIYDEGEAESESYHVSKYDIKSGQESLSRNDKILFQPRCKEEGYYAVDVWKIPKQSERAKIDIAPNNLRTHVLASATEDNTPNFMKKVYISKGIGMTKRSYRHIEAEDITAYKIGYSGDSSERIKTLEQKYGGEIRVIHEISSDRPKALEQVLHRIFTGKGSKAMESWEWFDLGEDDLTWLQNIDFVSTDTLKGFLHQEVGVIGTRLLFWGVGQ